MLKNKYGIGPIDVAACRTSVMLLKPAPPEQVIGLIETDRKIMAQHPGLYLKLLPLYMDSETSPVKTGGAYLFDTYENAVSFDRWLMNDLVVDDVAYTQRDILLEMTSKAWQVVGAHNLKDLYTQQTIMRVEEWKAPTACTPERLAAEWESLLDKAKNAGYSAVWLLHDDELKNISIITTFYPEMCNTEIKSENIFSRLDSILRISEELELFAKAEKTFERTSYIFNVWFPISDTTEDQDALWPNKFLLPGGAGNSPAARI